MDYSKGILALKLDEVMSEQAKKKQIRKPNSVIPNSAEQNKPIVVQKELAKIAGIGHNNMKKIKVIEREATSELFSYIFFKFRYIVMGPKCY